jgi:hypothetical protein
MVDPTQFEKWFDLVGTFTVDPISQRISVQGHCGLKFFPLPNTEGERRLPFDFDTVSGEFAADGKGLTTLVGCPTTVGARFIVSHNPLKDLQGGPAIVGSHYMINSCSKLVSLNGMATSIGGYVDISYATDLPLLRTLVAKKGVRLGNPVPYSNWDMVTKKRQAEEILSKYAGQGRSGSLACAAELSRAGFKGNARW